MHLFSSVHAFQAGNGTAISFPADSLPCFYFTPAFDLKGINN